MSAAALDRRGDGGGDARRAARARCPRAFPAFRSTPARIGRAMCSSRSRATRDGHDFVPAALAGGRRARGGGRGSPCRHAEGCAAARRARRARGAARSRARRARAHEREGRSPSPARSARPAPRKCCGPRSPDGETHASAASYNNHWGVPLSLARCPASADYAVFEIGMNHAGEIAPLSRLVRPHVAMITTIAPVHLEFFGTLEAIADAKAEIFLGLEPGGAAVINRDNAQFAAS